MRLLLSILAGLLILAGSMRGMRIPLRNIDVEAAESDVIDDFLQYLLQQEPNADGYAD